MSESKTESKAKSKAKSKPQPYRSGFSNFVDIYLLILFAILFFGVFFYSKSLYRHSSVSQDIYHKEYDTIFVNNSKRILDQLNRLYTVRPMKGRINKQLEDLAHKNDSIMAFVVANQLTIMKRQDDLVNDIRQETSNNIDRINSVLTFWLGIMSLVGVLVPIALQIRLKHSSEYELSTLREEKDRLQNDMHCLAEKFSYIGNISALQNISQCRSTPESIDSQTLIKCIWKDSLYRFECVFSSIFSEIEENKLRIISDENRLSLKRCLILLYTTLVFLDARNSGHRNNKRKIAAARKSIVGLIRECDYSKCEILRKCFDEVNQELLSIPIFE